MMQNGQRFSLRGRGAAVLLCLLLSLLLHLGLCCLLPALLAPGRPSAATAARHSMETHRLRIIRTKPKSGSDEKEQEEEKKELPFAKSSGDIEQRIPERADYEGARDSRGASAADAEALRQDKEAPAMRGELQEELNPLQQDFQDGFLAYDGKETSPPTAPPLPEESQPEVESNSPSPSANTRQAAEQEQARLPSLNAKQERQTEQNEIAKGAEQAEPREDSQPKEQEEALAEASPCVSPPQKAEEGELLEEGERPLPQQDQQRKQARQGKANAESESSRRQERQNNSQSAPPKPRRIYQDPSLANQNPAGFRSNERRSRSSGSFILGKTPSLNVAAGPRGEYEMMVYRRIAQLWYIACDEHRGDIIPGSLCISIRLRKNGRLENMQLVKRRGAGTIQQAFTFSAIRQASLPPMPADVQKEIVGELMELLFTFNFD